MAPHLGDEDWRSLAKQVTKEMDPAKLATLIAKLCQALDGERKQKVSVAMPPLAATDNPLRPVA
jgi:hypothetical protein